MKWLIRKGTVENSMGIKRKGIILFNRWVLWTKHMTLEDKWWWDFGRVIRR
jgi:hypothetical protein